VHPLFKDRRALGLYLLAWTLLGALITVVVGGETARWGEAAVLVLPLFLLYASICLAAWYPCRANPLPGTPPLRAALALLIAAALSTALWLALAGPWARWLETAWGFPGSRELYQRHLHLFVALGLLLYLLAAAVNYLFLALARSREAERRALELQVLAREAELEAFKTQIDPHFLFNCLNSISALCGTDAEAARRMATRLGQFLRSSLKLAATDRIPLAEELELARAYLEVEGVRYGDRLAFVEEIDAGCEPIEVPALLLQPLLENALKHGIAHLVDGGTVRLAARRDDGSLVVTVDNPRDPAEVADGRGGIGLANVRGRLDLIYHRDARLTTSETGDSFRVELRIPVAVEERPGA
jgi:two-component sensor histidine kinase